MKKVVTRTGLVVVFFALMSMAAYSFNGDGKERSRDTAVCLVISGNVFLPDDETNKATRIELVYFNEIVDSVVVDGNKKFRFDLKKDAYYAIRICKDGYVPRIISINTNLKVDPDDFYVYKFHFDTELIKQNESVKLNAEALEFPIAIVNFDEELDGFYYNEEYTLNIKREIYLKNNGKEKN